MIRRGTKDLGEEPAPGFFRRLYRETGLTPTKYRELIDRAEYHHKYEWRFHRGEMKVYSCRCRSVWCKVCAKSSPTNATITNRLRQLEWRRVRHVVLTVNRETPPEETFGEIRRRRGIARLVRELDIPGARYLWALEFHTGGWPHWHVFVESDRTGAAGRIGKEKIARSWPWGIVWESFIRSEDHWKGILGYHQSKGYLAGEQKAHQLELPDYLKSESRVRKFGTNIANPVARPDPDPDAEPGPKKPRQRAKTYEERECDTKGRVSMLGAFIDVGISGQEIRGRAAAAFGIDMIDHSTFRGEPTVLLDFIKALPPPVQGNTRYHRDEAEV